MALKETNRMLREFEKRMEGGCQGSLLGELNSPRVKKPIQGNHMKHNHSSDSQEKATFPKH